MGLSPTRRYCVMSPKARGGAGAAAGADAAASGAAAGGAALNATAASVASAGAAPLSAPRGARWTKGQLFCVHCDPERLWRQSSPPTRPRRRSAAAARHFLHLQTQKLRKPLSH